MRAHLQVRITPADIGKRVTIRSRIPAAPGAPGHTDTLGYLRSWADRTLVVERSNGARVELAESDIVAARTLGPPPQRRRKTP